jgi:hypothetical protein
MIVHLHEEQRMLEERNSRHSRECEAIKEVARVALASEQKKTRLVEFFLVCANKIQILEILKEMSPKTFYHFSNGCDCLHPLVAHTSPQQMNTRWKIKFITTDSGTLTNDCLPRYSIEKPNPRGRL